MDDDVLEIDSPMEPAVEIEEDEEIDEIPELTLDGAPTKAKKPKSEDREKMLEFFKMMPYECESLDEYDRRLDLIIRRLVDCVTTKDYDVGFVQWNHRLQCLISLKYPMLRQTRARLARFYYETAVLPGLEARIVQLAASMCMSLIEHKKYINIKDLVLPWKPLYNLLEKELFPKQRRTGLTNVSDTLLDLAEAAQRFFPPSEIDEMLRTFLPKMDGSNLNSVIATQAFLVHFLPLSHPQRWLPAMFRLWESFNSSLFDDQMLDLLARLAEMHVSDPRLSSAESASKAGSRPDARLPDETASATASGESESSATEPEQVNMGLFSEVGIFTEQHFSLIMTKCLKSAGLPVGASKSANAALMAQSSSVRTGPDAAATRVTLKMKKPTDRLRSFATILAYSISKDGPVAGESNVASAGVTPSIGTPVPGGSPKLGPVPSLRTYPAGSRALDHLARFVQATESYFHPSNWGMWQMQLSAFVSFFLFEFLKRAKEEERPECRIPAEYRLTPQIKRETVSILRTVCLLSMFSKDPLTMASSQASLKRMALLEPDLILPAVLDRAVNSLEALETTRRTNAIITSLSTLAPVLVSRDLYRAGGKHLVMLLQLCIPGIDLNDPMKTMSTCMFIIMSVMRLRIDDLTRPEVYVNDEEDVLEADGAPPAMPIEAPEGEDPPPTPQQEDYQLRMSTADFEPWVTAFFQKVFALFETLPEEGKGGKTGGKSEEQVVSMIMMASDTVCGALSPYLLEKTFKMVTDYCASTVSATSVRAIGSLVSCFARADSRLVLRKLVPLCSAGIKSELEHGASSIRTTSTSVPVASDAALHWHLSVLIGAMSYSGDALLEHRDELIPLLQLVTRSCKTERGYTFAAKLVQRVIFSLISIYPNEQRFVNPDLWDSDEFAKRSHLYWGKLYSVKEVKIDWHQPSGAEIDFCLEVFGKVVQPCLDNVEELLQDGVTRDKVWSNDFCRNLTTARLSLAAIPNLIEHDAEGGGIKAMDTGDEVPEFISVPPSFRSGFILTDRQDVRYQKVAAFKDHFGRVVFRASQTTQNSGAEDQIDCVKLLIRSVRTFLTSYSYNSDDYKAHAKSLGFYRNMTKLYAKQKYYPRILWIRRASYYITSRARLNSFHRKRTELTDQLILQMLEFCMSNYVGIRITAQNTLDSICSFYDGTRSICFPRLLEALQPGVSDDRMKGALYVLGNKGFSNLAIVDARFSKQYILGLLTAQHHSKPSIQKLVRGIINDFVVRFAEPSTLKAEIESSTLTEAANMLARALPDDIQAQDDDLLDRVIAKRKERTGRVDEVHTELTQEVMAIARNESTHWAFSIFAARLLRALVRKDKPLEEEPAKYLAEQVISENPKMRRYAQAAMTKVLYFLKLRTLSQSDKDLLLGQTTNPLKHKVKLPDPVTPEWTESYIKGFVEPMQPDTKLRDKSSQGWLVWGEEEEYYDPAPEGKDLFVWDPASQPALSAVWSIVSQPSWWESFFRHLSQEKDRNYLSSETLNLVKSLFAIFGVKLLDFVQPFVSSYISEKNRHKHRAAAEMISGLYRGSKHWPSTDQDLLWTWLGSLLPSIFRECTPDSQPAWQMCVEYMLQHRDPRRAIPLVKYIVQSARETIGKDVVGHSPWEQAKCQNLLRGALISLNLKFTAWGADEFVKLYSDDFDNDFQEVRSVISECLADLDLLRVHPSYGNVDQFLQACKSGKGSLLARPELYAERFNKLSEDLERWRKERTPTAQGTSQYDRAATTALLWISTTLGDHRNSAMAGQAIRFLPHIFAMLELHDNRELSALARAVLTKISTYSFTSEDASTLIHKLLTVTRNASESWRTRLDTLPILQVVFFQNLFYLDSGLIQKIIELLFQLLRDKHLEVREMAATTLSGIVRCSQRQLIKTLKDRFTKTVVTTKLPKRGAADFDDKLLTLHSGILGAAALLAAFPYEVPEWMPSLIVETVSQHTDDPVPISTTVRRCAADFKRTHQDTWSEDEHKFGEYLAEVNDFTLGRSDYFA